MAWILAGAARGFVVVGLGAFGAHGLRVELDSGRAALLLLTHEGEVAAQYEGEEGDRR